MIAWSSLSAQRRKSRAWAVALLLGGALLAGLVAGCASAAAPADGPMVAGGAEAEAELEEADAPVEARAAAPSLRSVERRAQEILGKLAAAGVEPSAPGQLTVVLDPGHGGPDGGAAANGVAEVQSNLDFALRIEEILLANGIHIVLTRRDAGVSVLSPELRGTGRFSNRPDREARAELAAFVDADAYVSIHSNGHPDPSIHGVEAWYHPSVLAPGENQHFGALILGRVLVELSAVGYESWSLGTKDDTCWRQFGSTCRSIYVLSPPITLHREDLLARGYDPAEAGFAPAQEVLFTRGTSMPAVLVELLFTSNPDDAAALRNGVIRQALAKGVAQGVLEMLRSQ